MAQVMMLIGLLLLGLLIHRAVRSLRAIVVAHKAQRHIAVDRQDLAAEPSGVDAQQQMIDMQRHKDNLEARIAVLERLIIDADGSDALPPPVGPAPINKDGPR